MASSQELFEAAKVKRVESAQVAAKALEEARHHEGQAQHTRRLGEEASRACLAEAEALEKEAHALTLREAENAAAAELERATALERLAVPPPPPFDAEAHMAKNMRALNPETGTQKGRVQ